MLFNGKLTRRAATGLLTLAMLLAVSLSYSGGFPAAAAANNPPAANSTNNQVQPNTPSDYQWSPAINVSRASIALGPNLSMNGGEAQIDFSLGPIHGKELYESYSGDNGHSWSGPSFLGCNNGAVDGSTPVQVAEDSHLNVYMVWQDYCDNARHLYFRKYDVNSNQWLPVRRLTTFNTNGASIAVGPNGVVHISYINVFSSGQSGRVEHIQSADGGNTFSAADVLSDNRNWVNWTQITVDTSNRPHVTYDKGPTGQYQIFAADFIGGAWQTTTLYSGRSYWPSVAPDHHGGVGIVWQINDAGVEIYYKHWNGATLQWDPIPTRISVDDSSNFNPDLTYDNNDNAYIAWTQSEGSGDMRLLYSYEYSAGVWSPEIFVAPTRATGVRLDNWNNNLGLTYQSDVDSDGQWQILFSWIQLNQASPTPVHTNTPTRTPTATHTPTITPTFTPPPTATPCADGSLFKDVCASYWAYYYIQALGNRAIISGQNGYYYPEHLITRAELTKIIAKAENWPLTTPITPTFGDVPPTYWAYAYIETAYAMGAVNGYTGTVCANAGTTSPCFLPNTQITRAETAVIIVRASNFPIVTPSQPSFPDVPPSNFAYGAIETAHARGILSGRPDGLFHPDYHTKRSEMAKIVYLALPAITGIVPSSAQAGSNTLVTMQGRNFGDPEPMTSTLEINGTAMNIQSWHDGVINFYVPAETSTQPDPATVALTSTNRLAFNEGNSFSVLPGPTATPGSATDTPLPTSTAVMTATDTPIPTDTPLPPTVTPAPTMTNTPGPDANH